MAKQAPFRTFLTSNGNPLNAGKVYTYTASTSTLTATYTDSTEGSALANPVVLDASGSDDIWLTAGTFYRFIITDSDDTIIDTIDNVDGVGSWNKLESNLDVNGNSIVSASAGDIAITPDGSGYVILDGQKWPRDDGSANEIVKTDGSGSLGWGGLNPGVVLDTTPQLGGDLDTNSFNILVDSEKGLHDENDNEQLLFTTAVSPVNYVDVTNSATSNAPKISSAGDDTNVGLTLSPKNGGNLQIESHAFPTSDGDASDFLVTDGAGTLSFALVKSPIIQFKYNTVDHFSTARLLLKKTNNFTSSDGTEIATLAITPTYSNSLIQVEMFISAMAPSVHGHNLWGVFRDNELNARHVELGAMFQNSPRTSGYIHLKYVETAETTSEITYKIRVVGADMTTDAVAYDVNWSSWFGGAANSYIAISELGVQ